ncbi:hypothetical protein HBI56_101700 [Parastagonospora nodorum]|nr:hypothetical protein HBH53_179330 [Parastagonospora nodorum]KAH4006021.1 hypothetical protein HBI10_022370 [Parastagonospora nodorum]KAH4011928.1 hypothetical protein HBI13_192730 [Parastagonospora nodorum]KAH4212720.1 hypothetical protein HBI95_041040 [Parastagonospora nodorum]KAH5049810.1 hypothetical protein HBH96_193750 [Parastagonospora nodorum]
METTGASGLPRKFTIQSNFGRARQHRSRKNRPCDVCRKRKTACIITIEPPCLFCKRKGLICQSQADAQSSIVTEEPVMPSPAASSQLSQDLGQRFAPVVVARDSLLDQSTSCGGEIVAPPNLDIPAFHTPTDSVYTLEDNPGTTAHSMGLASEQDPYFIDAFRSVLVSERDGIDADLLQVFEGGSDPDEHPVHFLLLHDEFPTHRNAAKHAAAEAIENIVWPHGPALVRLYFRHVHSTLPIISKCRFLRQYATAKDTISAFLRGAVYALACVFWNRDSSLVNPCPFSQDEIVDHAQESLRRELEAPNLSRLQASILLMHMMPPDIDSVETPYTWIMAAQVAACAQMIGLHQESAQWHISPWEKSLRRKLWWASFLTDCWSSVCHGNPPHIGNDTFTTLPPNLDDLRFDEDVPSDLQHMVDFTDRTFRVSDGARFLEMVSISRHLRSILDCSWYVKSYKPSSFR